MENSTDRAQAVGSGDGRLCLDFTNAINPNSDDLAGRPLEYSDLAGWALQSGVISSEEAALLEAEAVRDPNAAQAALESAVRLRFALHRIFSDTWRGDGAQPSDLVELNAALAKAMQHARVEPHGTEYRWGWEPLTKELDRILWPVTRSAADLLVSDELPKVRQCASDDCEWLFLDTTKNHSRRWCDMKECGNRAKARRHYERTHRAG